MNKSEFSLQPPHPESQEDRQQRLEDLVWGSLENGGLSQLLFTELIDVAQDISSISPVEKEELIRKLIVDSKTVLMLNLHQGLRPSWEVVEFVDKRSENEEAVIEKIELLILAVFREKIQSNITQLREILEMYFHQQRAIDKTRNWVLEVEHHQQAMPIESIRTVYEMMKATIVPADQMSLAPFLRVMQISYKELKPDDTVEKYRTARQHLLKLFVEGDVQSDDTPRIESTVQQIENTIIEWLKETGDFPELVSPNEHTAETRLQLRSIVANSSLYDGGIVKQVLDFAENHEVWEMITEKISASNGLTLDKSVILNIIELQLSCLDFLKQMQAHVVASVTASIQQSRYKKHNKKHTGNIPGGGASSSRQSHLN